MQRRGLSYRLRSRIERTGLVGTHRVDVPFVDMMCNDGLNLFVWPDRSGVILQFGKIQNFAVIGFDAKSSAGFLLL